MAARFLARLFVPLALIAVAAAIALVIVKRPLDDDGAKAKPARSHRHVQRVYTVKQGDSLSEIASKSGVSIGKIERLNPGLDPRVVRAGQRLKLHK